MNTTILKTKEVFGNTQVEMELTETFQTAKAVKVDIKTSFLEFGENKVEQRGNDIWIPKYIMEKKQAKTKLEWIFASKGKQLHYVEDGMASYNRAMRNIAEIEAQYGYGDDFVNQVMGVRYA